MKIKFNNKAVEKFIKLERKFDNEDNHLKRKTDNSAWRSIYFLLFQRFTINIETPLRENLHQKIRNIL